MRQVPEPSISMNGAGRLDLVLDEGSRFDEEALGIRRSRMPPIPGPSSSAPTTISAMSSIRWPRRPPKRPQWALREIIDKNRLQMVIAPPIILPFAQSGSAGARTLVARCDVLRRPVAVAVRLKNSATLLRSAGAVLRHQLAGASIRFGTQTNAWRTNPRDLASLLDVLGHMLSVGFVGFETCFANIDDAFSNRAQARRKIAATGLKIFGIYIFLPSSQNDPATSIVSAALHEKAIRGGAALGAKQVIFRSVPTREPDAMKFIKPEFLQKKKAFEF